MGTERLEDVFVRAREAGRKVLIVYIMAGDPDLKTTERLVPGLASAGADIIELGIPFSDPVADGPVIQAAVERALRAGTTLSNVLDMASLLRPAVDIPLLLMTYYNPVLQLGLAEFARRLAVAADGVIVPDLPFEEQGPLRRELDQRGLALVPLVAPTTPQHRVKNMSPSSRGFVYCISVTGVTGIREALDPGLESYTGMVRSATSLPLVIGFGVSNPSQARLVSRLADGVVVGSAVVEALTREGEEAAGRLVRELRAALDEEARLHLGLAKFGSALGSKS